jgi:WD40 repeat protein
MYRHQTAIRLLALTLAIFARTTCPHAQEKCPASPPMQANVSPNIFSAQQEVYLGEVEAAQIEHDVQFMRDDRLTVYVNRIVARLSAQMPPTEIKFHVYLIDSPELNSFSMAGGRIYVTRKIVAFTQNEDELAGLIGHEMGHVLSHQSATDMTALFQQILGVTAVGDRNDIEDKFNKFTDNAARNPKALEKWANLEEPEQYQADQVALYAMANAGYSPESFVTFFDRLAQTHGRTGGFLAGLVRHTTPNEKRLRLLEKYLEDLPQSCRGALAAKASDDFRQWQADVIGYSELDIPESLTGLLSKKALEPPLRSDITNLQFSPDGQFVLAQDDSSVFVLSRSPFALLFRFDAPDAHPAQFTPDSKSIVFDTRGLRIEQWDLATQKRTAVHELTQRGCAETKLSPDGKTLACLDQEYNVFLLAVDTGDKFFEKKQLLSPDPFNALQIMIKILLAKQAGQDPVLAQLQFSPDAHYFLAGSYQTHVAVDLTTRAPLPLHGNFGGTSLQGPFAFVGSDRIAAVNESDPKSSALLHFPDGSVIDKLFLGDRDIFGVAHGNYLVVRPVNNGPAGVLDITKKMFPIITKLTPAVDVYDNTLVVERATGELALMDVDPLKVQTQASLSLSPLGPLKATAVSPDLNWIALSGATRGGIWDLAESKQMYLMRSFHGAYFEGSNFLFADFPKFDKENRMIARVHTSARQTDLAFAPDDKSTAAQYGPILALQKPVKENFPSSDDTILQISDVHDGKLLWSRRFPKGVPDFTVNTETGAIMLQWEPDSPGLKDALSGNPQLASRVASIPGRKTTRVAEILDGTTGKELGGVAIDTGKGSFEPESGYSSGDFVVIFDDQNRTKVYTLSTGELLGSVFGTNSCISTPAQLLVVENQIGQVDVYRLPSLEKQGHLTFSSPVALEKFSADGRRLLVVTKNQNVYSFDSAKIAGSSPPAAAAPAAK